jgi:hypothetical protein
MFMTCRTDATWKTVTATTARSSSRLPSAWLPTFHTPSPPRFSFEPSHLSPPNFPQVFGHSAVSVALEIIRLRLVAFAFFRLPPAPVYIKMAFTIGWHGQLDRLFHPKKACRSPAVAVHSCESPNPSRGLFTSLHPQQARTRARKTVCDHHGCMSTAGSACSNQPQPPSSTPASNLFI